MESVVILLKDFLNYDICPIIFEHGGVGASGDLVQLAHLALGLIGEGEASHDGQIVPISVLFEKFNFKPISVCMREGLAIMNGTSVMGGIGMVNIIGANKLLDWSIMASSMISEIVESFDDHFSTALNESKLHEGQRLVASKMRQTLSDSRLVKERSKHLYQKTTEKGF